MATKPTASKEVQQVQADLQTGKQIGQNILGTDGLGKMRDQSQIQDVESRLLEQAEGFSGAETTARRESALQRIQQGGQAGSRALQAALARSGVKGGAAAAQIAQQAGQGIQQRANMERDLFVQGEEARRSGTQALSQFQQGTTKFDLGQTAAEKNIMAQSGISAAQIASSERTAERAAQAAEKGAQVQAAAMGRGGGGSSLGRTAAFVATGGMSEVFCFLEGTMIEMEDGTTKNIKDLKEGDMTLFGGQVTGTSGQLTTENIYSYKDTFVTGSHEIYENGTFLAVKDSIESELVLSDHEGIMVYPLNTENGFYVTNGFVSINSTQIPQIVNEQKAHFILGNAEKIANDNFIGAKAFSLMINNIINDTISYEKSTTTC